MESHQRSRIPWFEIASCMFVSLTLICRSQVLCSKCSKSSTGLCGTITPDEELLVAVMGFKMYNNVRCISLPSHCNRFRVDRPHKVSQEIRLYIKCVHHDVALFTPSFVIFGGNFCVTAAFCR